MTADSTISTLPASGVARPIEPSAKARSLLILQGLATPFFHRLASALTSQGVAVHRVCYSGGDRWLVPLSPGYRLHHYRGMADDLPAFYDRLLTEEEIDTILLFGDCREIHKPAIRHARQKGIRILVLEEGYTRPDWITMETGGTNYHSNLVHLAAEIPALAAAARTAGLDQAPPPMGTDMRRRIGWEAGRLVAAFLGRPFFPHYRSHRPTSAGQEIGGWYKRLLRLGLGARKRYAAILEKYDRDEPDFFLVPLQLNSDFQIRVHSSFTSVPDFIETVTRSFARHAPVNCRLLIKNHPLDNGLIDYGQIIAELAKREGVEGRVDFVEGGDLNKMLARTKGVILVNSSVGYAALSAGAPLKVLGRAIYDMGGLSDPAPLDQFWAAPCPPQTALKDDFLTVIRAYCQIRGDFFSEAGLVMAVEDAADVILGKRPRLPHAHAPDQAAAS